LDVDERKNLSEHLTNQIWGNLPKWSRG